MPNAYFSYPDASVFKNLFETISKLLEELKLIFTEEGLKIRAIDPSNVALIDVTFPKEAFTEYKVEGSLEVGLSMSTALKVMKRARRGDRLEIEADEENAVIRLVSSSRKEFKLRNIEVASQEIPELNLSFDARIRMISEPLKLILKDIELASGNVVFEAYEDGRLLIYSGEGRKYKTEITRESSSVMEITAKGTVKSTYDVLYLSNVLSLTKVSDSLTMEFSSLAPMRMEFEVMGGGKILYFLAPTEA
ncbi:MAG: proliferating cell nuclear antigen (pcna) [Fervidicoccaceae archaeon]